MWLLREKAVPSALGLLLALLPISGADYTPNGYDCDYKHVGVDQAVVRLDRFTVPWDRKYYPIAYHGRTLECRGCRLEPLSEVWDRTPPLCFTVSTRFPFRLTAEGKNFTIDEVLTFGDHGSYVIKVAAPRWNESFRAHLNVTVVHEPYDTWRPLTTLMGLVITAVVIDALVRWTVKEAASKEEVAGRGGYWNYLAVWWEVVAGWAMRVARAMYCWFACCCLDAFDDNKAGEGVGLESDLSEPLLAKDVEAGGDDEGSVRSLGSTRSSRVRRRARRTEEEPPRVAATPVINAPQGPSKAELRRRVPVVDAIRGLAVVLMVFVSSGGGGYWMLQYSVWDGLTVADLVLPMFIFASGASTALFVERVLRQDEAERSDPYYQSPTARLEAYRRIAIRSCVLFVLGVVLMNYSTDPAHMRVMGPLQYLALTNLYVPTVMISTTATRRAQHVLVLFLDTVCPTWRELIMVLSLPLMYALITYQVAMPGCPRGYLGPGGPLLDRGEYEMCTGGIHRWVDLQVFTTSHLLRNPSCADLYETPPYEPEGLIGLFNAGLLHYLGALAGRALLDRRTFRRLAYLITLTGGLATIGGFLCGFKVTGGFSPINRNMWSLSYVSLSAAIFFAAFTVLHVSIDLLGWWRATPLRQVGMNSLLIYIGNVMLGDYFPFTVKLPPAWTNTHGGMVLASTCATVGWIIIGMYLHKKKAFLKV